MLLKLNISVEGDADDIFYALCNSLEKCDKRVILLIDELDKFYEVSPDYYHWYPTLTKTQGRLAKIGDDRCSIFAAILCGSSAHISTLVSANGKDDPAFVKDFPLVKISINLNGTKFRTRRIYSTTPVELSTVSNILFQAEPVTTANIKIVRSVAFITGGVAREIKRLAKIPEGHSKDEAFMTTFHVEEVTMAKKTLSSPAGKFWISC